jgi:hypothetical protein
MDQTAGNRPRVLSVMTAPASRLAPALASVMAWAIACGGEFPHDAPRASASQIATASATSLRATAVSTSEIDLAWPQSPTPVSGWQVQRVTSAAGAYALIASLAATATSYADAGLPASSAYCFRVRSWLTTRKGTSYSTYNGPACATTFTPPPPPPSVASPSGVTAVPARDDLEAWYNAHVDVSWADNSTNETEFRLERASSSVGPWLQVTTIPANTTSVRWGASREQQVCFRVIAANSDATSNPSAPACTTPPANPTNLSALTTDHGIDLAWTDNSAIEDGYRVSRSDRSGVWTDLATLPANATSYSDAAISADETYRYRVQALKDGGVSNYSNYANGVLATTAPAAPLDLVALYWADMEGFGWLYFQASWVDASTNETGFRIESSADGVSGWATLASMPANEPCFFYKYDLWALVGASFGECYRVIAFNPLGDSAPTNVFCTGWGGAPTDLVATAVDQQSVDLSWTAIAQFEAAYDVSRSTSFAGPYEPLATLPPDATKFRDTGLTAGQEYWYLVVVSYPQNWQYDTYNWAWAGMTPPLP